MESPGSAAFSPTALRLLGPLAIRRDGSAVALPPSRKLRCLLAYLALSPHPVSRERLCVLFWDIPNDPRGELRWCLSKLRHLLDQPGRKRVVSGDDQVWLDLEGCDVDALRLAEASARGLDTLDIADLKSLAASCVGELLEGIAADGNTEFGHWLAGRRIAFRSCAIDVAAQIAKRVPAGSPDGLTAAQHWLDLAPLDAEAHLRMLDEFLHRHMLADCARHLELAETAFRAEGLDFAPLRDAWDRMREHPQTPAIPHAAGNDSAPPPRAEQRRASIAIMPFRDMRASPGRATGLGEALTHDVITRLARMRGLFVIARGSVFAIAAENPILPEIGRRLGVDYVATGLIEQHGPTIQVAVEVAHAATERIVWNECFQAHAAEQFAVLEEIGDGIVSSIAAEIENAERNRALLKHPDSLDAWEAYHRGLWHMYRFTPEENARAAGFFQRSRQLDPTFSRAYAGLSFTHWQNAFQRWGDQRTEVRLALDTAGESLLADDQNPAAHWSMGRALWLLGDHEQSVRELDRCVELSPNFALGYYSLSFVHALAGDPAAAIGASDHSRLLSPCDPLLFGMLGTRAIALVRTGALEEAAEWSVRAAARPNAHIHILAIAAHCLALAGRLEEARTYAGRVAALDPGYRVQHLIDTFRFTPDVTSIYRHAAKSIGMAG
jgi:DNA-binding SARP family transcriptional activator/tetratricopeptide (TPR) repeat protein